MRKRKPFKIASCILGSAFLLWLSVWFIRPFCYDNGLGLSRLLNGWHDSRFATFHRLFFAIENGMSRADLEAVIRRVYPPKGPRTPPRFRVDDTTHIILFLDPEGRPGPNCEGIFLQFADGTIIGKGYGMD